MGISGKLIKILKSIYDNATLRVKGYGSVPGEITVTKGVLQSEVPEGGVLV